MAPERHHRNQTGLNWTSGDALPSRPYIVQVGVLSERKRQRWTPGREAVAGGDHRRMAARLLPTPRPGPPAGSRSRPADQMETVMKTMINAVFTLFPTLKPAARLPRRRPLAMA